MSSRLSTEKAPKRLEKMFAQIGKFVLVIWLLGIYLPYNLSLNPEKRNGMIHNWTLCFPSADFSQYYLAGMAARYGLWGDLYPTFKPGLGATKRIYSSGFTDTPPALLSKVPYLPDWYVQNIAPPPQALLCLPLAFFSYWMSYRIWMTGLLLATVGVLFAMSAISRRLGGISGYAEGALFLFGCCIPLSPHIGGADNSTMFLVLCCGIAALSWSDRRPVMLGTALIIPAVFKGLTATWCPLLLIRPVKWGTLAWMAVLTLALNGAVLFLGGVSPYQTWLGNILPFAQDMGVQDNWDHCVNLQGMARSWGWKSFPSWAMTAVNLLGLVAVYAGFWKRTQPPATSNLAEVCAAIVALVVLFIFCNAVSWMYYLLFLLPFAGWAIVEFRHTSPAFQKGWLITAAVVLLILPLVHVIEQRVVALHLSVGTNLVRDFYFGIEVLFLILAYQCLWRDKPAGAST